MIPKKNTQEIDLNAKIDKDLATAQEQQKEKINKNTPKLAQIVGGKIKYITIIFFAAVIFYKIVFAPKPVDNSKKKQSSKNKIVKSSSNNDIDQQRLADKAITKSSKGSISDEKIDSKKIVSLDMQVLSNTEAINNVQVPKLNVPATPTLPMIDKITIKDEQISENNQKNNQDQVDDKNHKKKEDNVITNNKQQEKIGKLTKKKIKKKIKDKDGKTRIVDVLVEVDENGNIVNEHFDQNDTEYSIDTPLSEQLTIETKKKDKNKQTSIDNGNGLKSLDEMFILNGKGTNNIKKTNSSESKDDFILFDGSGIVEQEIVTAQDNNVNKLTNLENTIIAGKVMEAVLETSINSESPGMIKAVVSKDVFGEIGDKILIPRGSHLYGSYSAAATVTQTRALLTWTRIIRPDGLVISINADTHDQTGKKGIEGDINTRYGEILKNSLLYSFVTIATAIATEKIAGIRGSTSVVTGNGTSVVNTSPANIAATSVIETAKDIVDKMTTGLTGDLKPVFSIPQGMLLKVILNTDIVINSAYHRRTKNIEID